MFVYDIRIVTTFFDKSLQWWMMTDQSCACNWYLTRLSKWIDSLLGNVATTLYL